MELEAEGGHRGVVADWWRGGGGVGWCKWQGISHIMASQAPYRASPWADQLWSSGHRPLPTDQYTPTQSVNTCVDVLKLKNNYTATATFYFKVWSRKKRRALLKELFVCSQLRSTCQWYGCRTQFEKHSVGKDWKTAQQRTEPSKVLHSKRLKVRSQVQLIEGILLISRNKQRTKTTKSCLEQMPSLM